MGTDQSTRHLSDRRRDGASLMKTNFRASGAAEAPADDSNCDACPLTIRWPERIRRLRFAEQLQYAGGGASACAASHAGRVLRGSLKK